MFYKDPAEAEGIRSFRAGRRMVYTYRLYNVAADSEKRSEIETLTEIWRDGVTRTLTLRVGSRPEGSDMRVPQPPPTPNWNPGDDRDMRNMPDMPDGSRMQIMRRNGGLERLNLAFYQDAGETRGWSFWRIEGPGFVWNFRVLPHVHTFVNIGVPRNV